MLASSSSRSLLQRGNERQEHPEWNFSSSNNRNKVFGRDQEIKEIEECMGCLLMKRRCSLQETTILEEEEVDIAEEEDQAETTTVSHHPPLLVLHGIAGSGKSSLVTSYPWEEKHDVVLASGKFERQRMTEPYSAIIDAINDLVDQSRMVGLHQLLSKHEDITLLRNILPHAFQHEKRQKLLQKPVSDSNTDRRDIFKKQQQKPFSSAHPPSSTSFKSMIDSCNAETVNAALKRVISFLCRDTPVVLFLDDIHWADQSSLDVLKTLHQPGCQIDGLLVVVSYRDDEVRVRQDHPVTKLLTKDIHETRIKYIHLDGLDLDSVNSIVTEITKSSSSDPNDKAALLELSKVIHRKTGGNPFFVIQFLQYLRDESFLSYNYSTFKWEWGDLDYLESSTKVSDNVADVVAAKFHRLPESTRVTLKVASCLGLEIPLDVLCQYFKTVAENDIQKDETGGDGEHHVWCEKLSKIKRNDLESVLEHAVNSGILIHPLESSTKYMWSHDKLQQVTYTLIPESMRPPLHRKLGMLLWEMSIAYPDAEWMVFMAAEQLNRFSSKSNFLGREASKLNLEAAMLSLAKSALFPAMEMLRAGVQNLEACPNRWRDDYELCLEIYSLLSEVAVKLGQYEDAMDAVQKVDKRASKLEDKFRCQCVMLECVTSGQSRDYALGVEKTIEILRLYGESLPIKLLPGQLYVENKKLKSKLPGGRLDGLMDLPDMSDERSMKVTRLLIRYLGMYGLQSPKESHRDVATFATIRSLNIARKKGITQDTPMGVLWFASNLRMDGHYKEATEYSKFAIRLVDKFPQELGSLHGTIRTIVYCSLLPTTRAFNDVMDGILQAYRIGLRTGETEKAITGVTGYAWSYLCVGLPIGPLHSDLVSYGREANQLGITASVQILFKMFRQVILNLQQSEHSYGNPTLLKGVAMDQNKELAKLEGNGARMTLRDINSLRLMLACIYNKWDSAEELVDSLEPYLSYDLLIPRGHLRLGYMGLASLILYRKTGKKSYKQIAKKIIKSCKAEIKKGSINAHPMLVLLQAEESPSKESYENAIKICARLGLIHHEAFILERAAKFFLKKGRNMGHPSDAKYYLSQAYTLYQDWGATGKVSSMKTEYGSLVEEDFAGLSPGVNSSLKGRSRYSASDSSQMSEIIWKSFKIGSKVNASDLNGSGSDSTPRPGLEQTDRSDSSKTSTNDPGRKLDWTRGSSVSSVTSTSEGGSQSQSNDA